MFQREVQISYGLAAMVLGAFLWAFLSPLMGQKPYKNVEVISAEVSDGEFNIVATFTKTHCVFQRLNVIAFSFGETDFLNWRDMDGLPNNHDRDAGRQTLRITVDLEGRDFDRIEVRTRHDCDGATVDRVFMEYRP